MKLTDSIDLSPEFFPCFCLFFYRLKIWVYNIEVGNKHLFSYLCCNSIVCHWNVANFTHNWPNLRPLIATTQKGNVVGIFSKEEIKRQHAKEHKKQSQLCFLLFFFRDVREQAVVFVFYSRPQLSFNWTNSRRFFILILLLISKLRVAQNYIYSYWILDVALLRCFVGWWFPFLVNLWLRWCAKWCICCGRFTAQ